MMPVGPILLMLLAVLIHSGFLSRSLTRIGLTDRAGFLLTLAMLGGSLVEVSLIRGLTMNLGTGLLPLGLALYLLQGSRRWWEPLVALGAGFTAAGAIALLSRWLPAAQPTELNLFFLDAQYFYALVAGSIGYLVGHTRGASFAGAVVGVLGGDLFHYQHIIGSGEMADLVIRMSGGGFHGTALVAGVLALFLSDLLTAPPAERGEAAVDHLPQP
ncbi:MAG: hypothetical protein ACOY94_27530 [Bacillota bacterium]